MTPMQKLAMEERAEYDNASAEDRKGINNIGDFIHMRHPEISPAGVVRRSRLLRAGDRSMIFWDQIESGMTITTAVTLLRECEDICKEDKTKNFDDVVLDTLLRYESMGVARRSNGKVVRAKTPDHKDRAKRIARGEAPKKSYAPRTVNSRHKNIVREAIAAWIAARLPKNDPRARSWTEEFMREVDAVLDAFTERFHRAVPKRDEFFAACSLINIPRPRWGQRADQERAWKHRRAAMASTHPDSLGHEGGRAAFQAIADAYNVIVAYNDNLPSTNSSSTATGESDAKASS